MNWLLEGILLIMGKQMKKANVKVLTRFEPEIPEEIRNKIFEAFFTTKQKVKGVDLGLSVCYGIIKDHGGEIKVDRKGKKEQLLRLAANLIRSGPLRVNHRGLVKKRTQSHPQIHFLENHVRSSKNSK